MPIIETRLWDGATIDWSTVSVTESVRCVGPCRTVFPGDYRVEVDPQTGLCRECGGMETP